MHVMLVQDSCLFVHYMVVVFFYSVVIVFVNFCFTFLMRKDLLICFSFRLVILNLFLTLVNFQ